jgi:hypothetical protein
MALQAHAGYTTRLLALQPACLLLSLPLSLPFIRLTAPKDPADLQSPQSSTISGCAALLLLLLLLPLLPLLLVLCPANASATYTTEQVRAFSRAYRARVLEITLLGHNVSRPYL